MHPENSTKIGTGKLFIEMEDGQRRPLCSNLNVEIKTTDPEENADIPELIKKSPDEKAEVEFTIKSKDIPWEFKKLIIQNNARYRWEFFKIKVKFKWLCFKKAIIDALTK